MMTRRAMTFGALAAGTIAANSAGVAAAAEQSTRNLPEPSHQGGKPVMEALMQRHSTRAYSSTPLPMQLLSDLLWAANGVNRPNGERTAPYWRHIMVTDIYVAMNDGVWLYQPEAHKLQPYLPEDIRAGTGLQDFVGVAPLDLIYVAHGERMTDVGSAERRLFASVDAGFIGQNVYLFCASVGLGTVFRGAVPYESLTKKLALPSEQFITFAQTVGFPAN